MRESIVVDESQLEDSTKLLATHKNRIAALLFEYRTKQQYHRTLCLDFAATGELRQCLNDAGEVWAVSLRVHELLAAWPRTVPDQLDRAIALLAAMYPKGGDGVKPPQGQTRLPQQWVLAEDDVQSHYVEDHLLKIGWIEKIDAYPTATLRITPEGWRRVAELSRKRNRSNPVFVAMWFGGKNASTIKKQTELYEAALLPAIKAAGYLAHRSDRDEHNQGIMDKIRYDIQRAPFVVADFADNNNGVYYEAGLASGHGIEVIHCCPEGDFEDKHFDIAHRSLIKAL